MCGPWLRFSLRQTWTAGRTASGDFDIHMLMKPIIPFASISFVLLGLAACDSKVESSRKEALGSKADAIENKADTVRKDSKTDATNLSKQAAMDADAAKNAATANAEAEKKAAEANAERVRKAGEQAAKDLENKAKEIREQK